VARKKTKYNSPLNFHADSRKVWNESVIDKFNGPAAPAEGRFLGERTLKEDSLSVAMESRNP